MRKLDDDVIPEVHVEDDRAEPAGAINAPKLLSDVHAFLGKFVAYPSDHAQVAHTLWIVHMPLDGCVGVHAPHRVPVP